MKSWWCLLQTNRALADALSRHAQVFGVTPPVLFLLARGDENERALRAQSWSQYADLRADIQARLFQLKTQELDAYIAILWKKVEQGVAKEEIERDINSHRGRADILQARREGVTDFSGWNLQGADLSDADLMRGDFSGANLEGANLQDANFWLANFRGANLRDANLKGANFRWADFPRANLSGVVLAGLNLAEANFWQANLQGVVIRDSNLSFANLQGANLKGTIFDNNIMYALNVKDVSVSPTTDLRSVETWFPTWHVDDVGDNKILSIDAGTWFHYAATTVPADLSTNLAVAIMDERVRKNLINRRHPLLGLSLVQSESSFVPKLINGELSRSAGEIYLAKMHLPRRNDAGDLAGQIKEGTILLVPMANATDSSGRRISGSVVYDPQLHQDIGQGGVLDSFSDVGTEVAYTLKETLHNSAAGVLVVSAV